VKKKYVQIFIPLDVDYTKRKERLIADLNLVYLYNDVMQRNLPYECEKAEEGAVRRGEGLVMLVDEGGEYAVYSSDLISIHEE